MYATCTISRFYFNVQSFKTLSRLYLPILFTNVYEEGRTTTIQVDEFMKRRLETKLMEAVLKYKVLD